VISRSKNRELLAWTLAALLSLVALILAVVHFREKPAEVQPVRFQLELPDKVTFGQIGFPVMSPNGRYLVISEGFRWQATPLASFARFAEYSTAPYKRRGVLPVLVAR
jgi:hypothetical protein